MNRFAAVLAVTALALSACGPQSGSKGDAKSAGASAQAIPPGPTGPVYATSGTVVAADGATVTLDHEGAAGSGLAAGRTTFHTWADVIAPSPGEPGARVAVKVQKLGDGWAVVEMTGR